MLNATLSLGARFRLRERQREGDLKRLVSCCPFFRQRPEPVRVRRRRGAHFSLSLPFFQQSNFISCIIDDCIAARSQVGPVKSLQPTTMQGNAAVDSSLSFSFPFFHLNPLFLSLKMTSVGPGLARGGREKKGGERQNEIISAIWQTRTRGLHSALDRRMRRRGERERERARGTRTKSLRRRTATNYKLTSS